MYTNKKTKIDYVFFRIYSCLGCFSDVLDSFQVPFLRGINS